MRWCAMLFLLCLLSGGCRQNLQMDAYLELLNAEKRSLEDRIYDLEYDYERKLEELEVCHRENAQLRAETGAPPRPARDRRARPAEPARPGVEPDEVPDFAPPRIESGTPFDPDRQLPLQDEPLDEQQDDRNPLERDQFDGDQLDRDELDRDEVDRDEVDRDGPVSSEMLPEPVQLPEHLQRDSAPGQTEVSMRALDSEVSYIHLNPLLTGADDFDNRPGDDGLSVLIEPRNAADELVLEAGRVSIVLLDPSQPGDAARFARWDFERAEVQRHLKAPPDKNPGIHLQMQWPQPPDQSQLQLFVRYHTADGRKLQAQREILVALPGQFSSRWTPRSADEPLSPSTGPTLHVARQPSSPEGSPDAQSVAPSGQQEQAEQGTAAVPGEEPRISDRPVWRPER